MDTRRWREDLEQDLGILEGLLFEVSEIKGVNDSKLQKLKKIVSEKIENPFNPGNKKVLIFTAFADTANYLYKELSGYFENTHQIHSAIITGSRRVCTSKKIPTELNTLLTCFSPKSKNKELIFPGLKETIDIIIATDCISEGQNLQDCDYMINYDIHWNPVRIIQRFGRIDRIGSTNDTITMVNFWPDITLDAYIDLKQRVENKMLITNMSSTGDDNLLRVEEQEMEYRKVQLQKLQSEVIDLEDLREGVSITDLGLNDFRIDLSNYFKIYGEPKSTPQGLHAVSAAKLNLPPGVLFVLKNINTSVNIDKLNRLHPYYMVYISNEGEIIFNHVEAKKNLDSFRVLAKGISKPIDYLCEDLNHETDDYTEMNKYSGLLKKAISSILKTEEEKDILSLFKSGGTTALDDKIKGSEDFVLVSFLIVK
jgi:hypothetical protein